MDPQTRGQTVAGGVGVRADGAHVTVEPKVKAEASVSATVSPIFTVIHQENSTQVGNSGRASNTGNNTICRML